MPTVLTSKAIEESTYIITAAFTDEDGNAVTPNSLAWTLTDDQGAVINSRENVSLTPGESVQIVLSGDDLALAENDSRRRRVLVEGVYDSNAGSGLAIRDEVVFVIQELLNAPT
jgi:hypothetical protein